MGSQTVPIYRMTGQLTHRIEEYENVVLAQKYLLLDGEDASMEEYLDPWAKGVVSRLEWHLSANGLDYYVEAICNRELTEAELTQLGEEVSGQNSDGHGENFEQQDFASWGYDGGDWDDDDEDEGGMCSFDWQTNEHKFVRVN